MRQQHEQLLAHCQAQIQTVEAQIQQLLVREDLSRVRSPKAALVLGMIRRVIVSLAHATVDRVRQTQPKTKANTKSFQQRFRSTRGGRERLHALLFAKNPTVMDLRIWNALCQSPEPQSWRRCCC